MRLRVLPLLSLLTVAGCAYTGAQRWDAAQVAERVRVERLDDNSVEISWPAAVVPGSVDIFVGLSPDAIDRGQMMARTSENSVKLSNDNSPYIGTKYRLYYELMPTGGGVPLITAERRLPLEGPDNFRDLGGYATEDGRYVRWNRLYRANDLSGLTGHDLEYLSGVGIKLICDFRSERERLRAPDREFPQRPPSAGGGELTGPEWLNLTIEQTGLDPETVREQIQTGRLSETDTRMVMRRAYRSFVTDYADQWAELFRRISVTENLPTVVHCTAGKDRTGFASALILLAVGVPEETVFEDYMLTNYYRRNFYNFALRWISLYSLFRTNPDDVVPLLEARPEYLRESLDTIRAKYGSVNEYLSTELGVTPQMLEKIRKNLLTDKVEAG